MKIGSLFTGYGGLDMALGGEVAWYSEIEPAACKVLAAHYPGVPNLGDITAVDWSQVEPVDVITGGYPCQPFSNAGMRKGQDDERHLWPYVRDAIGALRPAHAVLENVRGHLTLGLADVIGDLAALGYDTQWGVVRASDAGAPHNRARVFIVANATGTERRATQSDNLQTRRTTELGECVSVIANSGCKRYGGGKGTRNVGRLESKDAQRRETFNRSRQEFGTGSLARWGQYAPAIIRWEHTIGRPAPAPTVRRNDRDRLSPAFVEWMMGLPEGHVTGHGLSPSAELKMLGNGVVPQQARLALSLLRVE